MDTIKAGYSGEFKVPSAIPQDLLLIHDLVGGDLSQASSSSQNEVSERSDSLATHTMKPEDDDTDSIASSSGEDSLDEEGDVDMLKVAAPTKVEEVDKGAESEEEVEAGLLGGSKGGDPMTM